MSDQDLRAGVRALLAGGAAQLGDDELDALWEGLAAERLRRAAITVEMVGVDGDTWERLCEVAERIGVDDPHVMGGRALAIGLRRIDLGAAEMDMDRGTWERLCREADHSHVDPRDLGLVLLREALSDAERRRG